MRAPGELEPPQPVAVPEKLAEPYIGEPLIRTPNAAQPEFLELWASIPRCIALSRRQRDEPYIAHVHGACGEPEHVSTSPQLAIYQ